MIKKEIYHPFPPCLFFLHQHDMSACSTWTPRSKIKTWATVKLARIDFAFECLMQKRGSTGAGDVAGTQVKRGQNIIHDATEQCCILLNNLLQCRKLGICAFTQAPTSSFAQDLSLLSWLAHRPCFSGSCCHTFIITRSLCTNTRHKNNI